MRISVASLCDFAQVRDGMLFVSSGNATIIGRTQYPAPIGVTLALSLASIDPDDIGDSIEVDVALIPRGSDEVVLGARVQAELVRTERPHPTAGSVLPFVLDLSQGNVPAPGDYVVRIKCIVEDEMVDEIDLPLHAALAPDSNGDAAD